VAEAAAHVEEELREFIRWMNSDVVPKARTQGSKALRVASRKLQDLADYMDQQQQERK
jgi:glutamyl-tRNA reductase